jgi:hypothetical protein
MVSLLCYSLKLCHPVGSPFRDFPIHFINLIKELPRLPLGLSRSLNRPHALISAVACPHPLSMDVPPWSSPYASLGSAWNGCSAPRARLAPPGNGRVTATEAGSTWKWARRRRRPRRPRSQPCLTMMDRCPISPSCLPPPLTPHTLLPIGRNAEEKGRRGGA